MEGQDAGSRIDYAPCHAATLDTRLRWWLPSVQIAIFVLVFWANLLFMPQILNADGDLSRHLTIGNVIFTTRQIPTRDLFSHTLPNAPVVLHEWLSQVVFATANGVAGLNGVAWLTALVIAATYTILAYALRDAGVRALVTLGGAFTAFIAGAIHALARPHIFTTLFFAAFLFVIERYRRSGNVRLLFLLPPLMIVWANLHGAGLIFGLILIGLYIAGAVLERNRRSAIELSALWVFVLLASLVNPAGLQLLTHTSGFLGSRFILDITTEYQSPNFHAVNTWVFAVLIVASLAMGWRGTQKLAWTNLILLVSWTGFGLYTARNIPLYALVAIIVLAPVADTWIAEAAPALNQFVSRFEANARLASGWIWAVAVAVVLIALEANGAKLDLWRKGNVLDANTFPIAAVDSIKSSPPEGNVFNDFNWGGYLLYRLYPDKKIFIDGFTDFYGEQLTREYLKVVDGTPGWEEILERRQVQWVIVPPTGSLADRLDHSAQWISRYKDKTAGVWVKK